MKNSPISFTTLSLQKLVKNYWIKSSGRNNVIYNGIEDETAFVIVESVAEK